MTHSNGIIEINQLSAKEIKDLAIDVIAKSSASSPQSILANYVLSIITAEDKKNIHFSQTREYT